ncbi:MAG TPA: CIA30 family protein [Pseudohongiella sp.]|nr:CIA30 family protein [Pseudohongiella sp.]HBX37302.1 CIA30 family protein [Pseudohongiella sp.]|tara:strand:+ start:1564 stop:2076 length:513 start_codon:yes stop_codon:yes gene_type:complete
MISDAGPGEVLFNFTNPAHVADWRAINDGVMGGESSSAPEIRDGCLHFSGHISLENNGGFASIRSQQRMDLSTATGVILRVKGDGRRYQFRLYTDARYHESRIAYSCSFNTTAGQWLDVSIEFSSLEPVFRGRLLSGPAFNAASVEQMGFLLADKQQGDFHLLVDWIHAV